jgi:glycosyltransferase 2 family protein
MTPLGNRFLRGVFHLKRQADFIKGLLKYLVGIGVLAFVLWRNWADKPNPDPDLPPLPGLGTLFNSRPDWGVLSLMMGIIIFMTFLQFYRWYLLVRALDLPFTIRDSIRLGLVGVFYNTALPGSVGGDLIKAYFIVKDQPARKPAAVATIVADRLVGLFGLLTYAAIVGGYSWFTGNDRIVGNAWLERIILVATIVVVSTSLGYALLGIFSAEAMSRFSARLHRVPKIGHALGDLWYAVAQYRQRPLKLLSAVGLTFFIQVLMILVFHLAVQVFPNPDASLYGTLPEHFVIAPIGYIAQVFFPAPGGVGGAEYIFGSLYKIIRGPNAEVIGVVGRLTMRLGEWSFGFVGYLAFLRMKKELPISVEEDPEAKSA